MYSHGEIDRLGSFTRIFGIRGLDYGSLVWDPHSGGLIDQFEKLQTVCNWEL